MARVDVPIAILALGVALSPLCRALGTPWTMMVVVLLVMGIGSVVILGNLSLRPYRFTLPLAIIPIMALLSQINTEHPTTNALYISYIVGMFCLFLAVKDRTGSAAFKYVPIVALMTATTVIIEGLINPGVRVGGFAPNPNTAAGFLALTLFLLRGKQLWLAPLILAAIYFTGYRYVLMALPLLVVLMYFDSSIAITKKQVSAVLMVLVLLGVFGFARYDSPSLTGSTAEELLTGRVATAQDSLSDVTVIGHGYDRREPSDIHNVPLLISVEFGIPAALAWLFIMGMLIVRSKWRYPALMLFALSMVGICWQFFDLSPYFWVLAGLGAGDA